MEKPRILVTGANGFSGSYITQYLHEQSYPIYAHHGRQRSGNLADPSVLLDLPKHVDVLVHVAASPDTAPEKNIRADLRVADNLVNWVKARGSVKKIIFFSSISVYGKVYGGILTEDFPRIDPDVYGGVKFLCEETFRKSGIPTMSLRLPAIVGKGAKRHWLANIMAKGKALEDIEIYSEYGLFNNAVHVEFLAELVVELINREWPTEVMLVGSRGTVRIIDIIHILATGSKVTVGLQKKESFLIALERLSEFMEPWHIEKTLTRYLDDELAT